MASRAALPRLPSTRGGPSKAGLSTLPLTGSSMAIMIPPPGVFSRSSARRHRVGDTGSRSAGALRRTRSAMMARERCDGGSTITAPRWGARKPICISDSSQFPRCGKMAMIGRPEVSAASSRSRPSIATRPAFRMRWLAANSAKVLPMLLHSRSTARSSSASLAAHRRTQPGEHLQGVAVAGPCAAACRCRATDARPGWSRRWGAGPASAGRGPRRAGLRASPPRLDMHGQRPARAQAQPADRFRPHGPASAAAGTGARGWPRHSTASVRPKAAPVQMRGPMLNGTKA